MNTIENIKDLIIIGSGPAGYSAAIYAVRSGMSVLLLQGIQPGGQLTTTTNVENYPGFVEPINGPMLMSQMEKQAKKCGADIKFEHVSNVDFTNIKKLKISCASGNEYFSKTCIIATGAKNKWLGLGNEDLYKGYGVSSCAVCDGTFFKDKNVMVVGGGNTAIEEALYLSKLAKKVFIVHRRSELRADKVMQDRVFKNEKIEIIWDHVLNDIIGESDPKRVVSAEIKNIKNESKKHIDVEGIFIAIGHEPSTEAFLGKVETDQQGYIKTKLGATATSVPGVFAAGDVQDKKYRQAITAASTGCMAALEAYWYLKDA